MTSERGNWQKMLQERRLQHQLEIQSRQIESVLSQHDVSARVAGGYVQPRSIRFDLSSHLETGLEKLRHIKQELLSTLGATEGDLIPHLGGWQLHVTRPEEPPVSLFDLLSLVPDLEPMTILLGLDDNGRPVLVELADHTLSHMLIAGTAGAGKSTLLRTIALSLALTHRQSQLQLAILDGSANGVAGSYTSLEPLSYLPHMLAAVTYSPDECRELVHFLVGECTYRQEQQMDTPKIVVLIDEVVHLLNKTAAHHELSEGIIRLLQRGPDVGIHLVMTTDQPESARLTNAWRTNLPVRLVGKVADERIAAAAASIGATQAEYLLGSGDFLAIVDEQMVHFQAAFVGDYDLHLTLETLHRSRPQPLVAQPVPTQKLAPTPLEKQTSEARSFSIMDTVSVQIDEAVEDA